MLKFKIIGAVVKALSSVAAATKAKSDGGAKITAEERDEIIGACMDALVEVLDPVVSTRK